MKEELRRFFPALLFVGKFLLLYTIGNLLYGWMIELYAPRPDPVTEWVSHQTAGILTVTGYSTLAVPSDSGPTIVLNWGDKRILAVYEGCNGVNVMIVFLAFMVGIGPYSKKFLWFVVAGLTLIHVMNLLRLLGLCLIALHLPEQFYFVHKYLFTSVLYVVIFSCWLLWFRISGLKKA